MPFPNGPLQGNSITCIWTRKWQLINVYVPCCKWFLTGATTAMVVMVDTIWMTRRNESFTTLLMFLITTSKMRILRPIMYPDYRYDVRCTITSLEKHWTEGCKERSGGLCVALCLTVIHLQQPSWGNIQMGNGIETSLDSRNVLMLRMGGRSRLGIHAASTSDIEGWPAAYGVLNWKWILCILHPMETLLVSHQAIAGLVIWKSDAIGTPWLIDLYGRAKGSGLSSARSSNMA